MKTWYLTREGNGELIHRGTPVPPGKKILLNEVQANLHNKKVTKTETPKTAEEAFLTEEFEEFQNSRRTSHAGEEASPAVSSSKQPKG